MFGRARESLTSIEPLFFEARNKENIMRVKDLLDEHWEAFTENIVLDHHVQGILDDYEKDVDFLKEIISLPSREERGYRPAVLKALERMRDRMHQIEAYLDELKKKTRSLE